MALQFQPYNDAAGKETRDRWAGSLDSLFNAYQAAKKNNDNDRAVALATQITQQQLAQGRRSAALSDIQETAQFGAPLSSYTPQQVSQAGAGIQPQGPGLPADQSRLQKLAEGLHAIGAQQGMAMRQGEAKIGEDVASARLKNTTADLYAKGGATPGQNGPEIVTKDGQSFIANRDVRGNVRYSPNTGSQIQSEVGTKIGLAQDGLANLDYIESILKSPKGRELAIKAGGSLTKLKSLGDPDAEKLANAIFQAGDAEARVKTGAAINTQEVEDYFKALVNPVGTMTGNLDRVSRKKGYFNSQMAIYGQGRNIPQRPGVQSPQSGPEVGTIKSGYRFKGGNPADQSSWEKQ